MTSCIKREEFSNWKILWGSLGMEPYYGEDGSTALRYKPKTLSREHWAGYMHPVENSYKGKYGEIVHSGRVYVYVGDEPVTISFREKRSKNSSDLSNIWSARVYSHDRHEDGSFKNNYNTFYASHDGTSRYGYNFRFHNLDGSTSENISGDYDEWITNYITLYPSSGRPFNYIEVQFSKFLSTDKTWEGLIDDIWVGPESQFNPSYSGKVIKNNYHGKYNNDRQVGDPVNIVTGSYYYETTDLSVPSRGLPIDFSRVYNSTSYFDSPLGKGWSHSYHSSLIEHEDETVSVNYPDGTRVRIK